MVNANILIFEVRIGRKVNRDGPCWIVYGAEEESIAGIPASELC